MSRLVIAKSMGMDISDRIQKDTSRPELIEAESVGDAAGVLTVEQVAADLDDIRIQSESSNGKASPVDKSNNSDGVSDFLALLDHLVVILPSAFGHAGVDGVPSPFVTFDPKHIESSGKVLSVIDKAADTILDGDFLSQSPLGDESWAGRINGTSLPIYALLLARIELAIIESYQQREGTVIEGTGNALVHSEKIQKLLATTASNHDQALSLQNQAVNDIVQPFHEICKGSISESGKNGLDIMTPLTWLVQSRITHGTPAGGLVDSAVTKANTLLPAANVAHNEQKATDTANTEDMGSPTKKTKKKRKRLRNKKDRRANAVQGEAPPPSPGSSVLAGQSPTPSHSTPQAKRLEENRIATGTTSASVLYISDDSDDDCSKPDNGNIGSPRDEQRNANAEKETPTAIVAPVPQNEDQHQSGPGESDEAWETVEVKSRNNRKKVTDRAQQRSNKSNGHNNNSHDGQKKSKNNRANNHGTRKRNNNMKKTPATAERAVGERTTPVATPRAAGSNPWNSGPQGANEQPAATLRDIVMGKHASRTTAAFSHPQPSKRPSASPSAETASNTPKPKLSPSTADQNTAPTFQETISSASNTRGRMISHGKAEETMHRSESSSGDSHDAPQNQHRAVPNKTGQGTPVPTLLSPQNGNSSTSSVASSLEAPHTSSHRHHHSGTAPDSTDVGYHLLDVCDRLSRDMGLFMGLRAQALTRRRREREELLGSLQKSVAKLWPGQCRVQLYGSCAARLDLPSSDLDVVVVGLPTKHNEHEHARNNGSGQHVPFQRSSPNSDRIRLLGAELEKQSWAVRVNAITTASVPVVKVLADPGRLQGIEANGEWADGKNEGTSESQRQMVHPWRGADVMNGLLSFDITFEGPEHGGLWSTDFSLRVVTDACNKTGLPPDETPLVQVLMVLKELLAQRKLNEPYSGGLSSYAILLLVVALLRERDIIREDIARADRYRRAVSGSVSSRPSAEVTKPSGIPQVSSWAAIAKSKSTPSLATSDDKSAEKPSSFADAVARSGNKGASNVTRDVKPGVEGQGGSDGTTGEQPLVGYNDVIEVLCSGELTAGKLLMHFLLHYGKYFDAQATAIDVSGKHERDMNGASSLSYMSPFIPRTSAGSIDPVTGMLTVDPIVIYDPLVGHENNNVGRRCFAWSSIRWIFAQSYATLSNMVERNSTPPSTPSMTEAPAAGVRGTASVGSISEEGDGQTAFDLMDPSSPILRSLLSF